MSGVFSLAELNIRLLRANGAKAADFVSRAVSTGAARLFSESAVFLCTEVEAGYVPIVFG
jgi:hypothetical protein